MWELGSKEGWASKNLWFWTVLLEKTLKSALDCKEIQPVHPKGNQSLIFIGRTDVEAETPILWPPDAKNWFIWKDPDAGKIESGGERDDSRLDDWMASLTRWTWVWVGELVMYREAWYAAVHAVTKSLMWMSDWSDLNWFLIFFLSEL